MDLKKKKKKKKKKHLYIFGTRATVKKWKYHQQNKDKSKSSTTKHSQVGDTDDEQDIKISLKPQLLSPSFRATPTISTTSQTMSIAAPHQAPSRPPRSTAIKARGIFKEAAEDDLDH